MCILFPHRENGEGHGRDRPGFGCGAGENRGRPGPQQAPGLSALGDGGHEQEALPHCPLQTERPLQDYRLVIIGTPAWAGRCASPVKSFLAQNAESLPLVSCVVTRSGADRCDDVLAHMATFLKRMRLTDVSLRPDDAGYEFWRDKFIQDTKNALVL